MKPCLCESARAIPNRPLDGSEQGTWDVTFDCLTDPTGHTFTCWFENGVPVTVSVDGGICPIYCTLSSHP